MWHIWKKNFMHACNFVLSFILTEMKLKALLLYLHYITPVTVGVLVCSDHWPIHVSVTFWSSQTWWTLAGRWAMCWCWVPELCACRRDRSLHRPITCKKNLTELKECILYTHPNLWTDLSIWYEHNNAKSFLCVFVTQYFHFEYLNLFILVCFLKTTEIMTIFQTFVPQYIANKITLILTNMTWGLSSN